MFANQHQITDVNDCRKKKAENERHLPNIDCINQHHHAASDAEIPKLDGDDAPFETFRNVPLDYKATGEKQVSDQAEDRPKRNFAGNIAPKIVQIV